MNRSKNKESILIPQNQIGFLQKRLESTFTRKEPTSKFHIFHGHISLGSVMLYKSGILVYDQGLENILSEILNDFDIKLIQTGSTKKTTKSKGKKNSIWLADYQLYHFLKDLEKEGYSVETTSKAQIFSKGNSEIQLSKNGIITYFSNDIVSDLIFECISNQKQFSGIEILIGLSAIGLKSVYGPIIVSYCHLNLAQAIHLQLNGLRHPSISRSKNLEKIQQQLEDLDILSDTKIITPKEINEMENPSDAVAKIIGNLISSRTSKVDSSTAIYISLDNPLISLLNESIDPIIDDNMSTTSMANALAANIATLEFENWKSKVEKKLGYYISPKLKISNEQEKSLVFHEYLNLQN